MITIFNRKEVYSTYSIESQARARAALEHHGIDYVICTTAGMARNYGSGPIGLASYPTLFIYGFRIVYILNKTLFIVLNSQHEDVLFCLGNFPFPCLYDNTSKGISQHFPE